MPTSAADALQDLVDALTAAGVQAATDPSDVNTPGVWVTLDTLTWGTLAGDWRPEASAYLIVQDKDTRRALDSLQVLLDTIVPSVVVPDGPVVSQGVILPGDPTPLPALRIPLHLY